MYDTWCIMQLWTKRHLSRKLSLLILPSTPVTRHAYGWWTIPASVAIAYLLLGIEEIGVQIEEP
jgi:predicted membrane chloride channel (bestrophin family)